MSKRSMVMLLLLVGAAAWAAALGAFDGRSSSKSTPSSKSSSSDTRPGSPRVYREIEGTSDCSELQVMFDTAADNNEREPAGSELFYVTLSYMNAADDQLRAVGCYS